MEILFISHKYPPTIGGMEKQSYELVTVTEKKHKVHKVVLIRDKESRFSFFTKLKSRVKTVLRENPGIDIIHLNDGLMGYFGLWLQSYTNIPTVLTFHGLDLVFPPSLYQEKIVPRFKGFDGFICVSEATAQEARNRGFDDKKIFVVSNGVDHDLAKIKTNKDEVIQSFKQRFGVDLQGRKIIAGLGRPVRRKGFSWFMEHVLPRLGEDVLFVLTGPVPESNRPPWWKRSLPGKWVNRIELFLGDTNDGLRIEELKKREDIRKRTLHTGKLPFNELMAFLGMADLFVMPNVKVEGDAEGFGLVALEASLRKTPVLASNMEGITQAIQDGKNGYLLPSQDADAWVNKIHELLLDRDALGKLGEQFQKYTLDTFSWDKMAEEYVEVFEEILEDVS